jgi:hypothetical protein
VTLRGWNSFQYDSFGWSGLTRTAGTGQSGYGSLRATGGVASAAVYGHASAAEVIHGFCYQHTDILGKIFFAVNESGYGGDRRISHLVPGELILTALMRRSN